MLSSETKLLNIIIALQTKSSDGFPSPLFDVGYRLEGIETAFTVKAGDLEYNVRPDLQLKSDAETMLLFIECKDGNVEKKQLEHYMKISEEDIKNSKITSLDSSKTIGFDLMYFGTGQKKEKLIKSIDGDRNLFPIVIYENDLVYLYKNPKGGNVFSNKKLNGVFETINVKNPPVSFIPFTINDRDEFIMLAVLRDILSFVEKPFTVEELAKNMFGNRYDFLPADYIKSLKAKVGQILKKLRDEHLKGHLSYSRDEGWSLTINKIKPFSNACEKVRKNLIDNIYRSSLKDFEEGGKFYKLTK